MARLNQQYYADNVSLKKEGRTLSLEQEFLDKLEEFPDVIDNVTSDSSTDALSANMGRHLQDQIDQLSSVGTFLSLWDCTTGLPTTDPTTNPYQYKVGTYYIVDNVADAGGTNYRPKGSQYNAGVASTDVETEDVKVGDWYLYDGTVWIRQPNSGKEIVIDEQLSLSSRNAVENRVVTAALNNKQDTISDLETIRQGAAEGATSVQPGDNISVLTNNLGYQTEGDVVNKLTNYYTKTEADALLNDKADNSDVSALESRVGTLETSSGSQGQEIANIETNITNIEGNITTIQGDIADIKTDITNIEGDITTIEGNITTIQGDITDIKGDITAIEGDITTIKGDITDIKGDVTNLQTAVDGKQDKLTAGNNIQITGTTISATDTIYTAGRGIEIKNGDDYSAMRGPCPEGFHVPQKSEFQALIDAMTAIGIDDTQRDSYREYLKIPNHGFRYSDGNIMENGNAILCSSSPVPNGISSYSFQITRIILNANLQLTKSSAGSIRPFKDTPAIPNNTWTKLYGADTAGIFYNTTQGLISIVNGSNVITITDKNLGATQVYNFGDILTNANCGNYYQRGNNYGFPGPDTPISEITTSPIQVDTTGYGPGNYYESNAFIQVSGDWSNPANDNLRGGVTGVVQLHNAISITETAMDSKQDALVSGDNIKTINGIDILGSGDISISPLGNLEFVFWLGDGSSPASGTYDISAYSWVYMIGSNGSNGWTYPYFFPTSMMTGGRSFGSFQPGYNNYWEVQGNSLDSLTFSTPRGQFIHVYGVV